MSRKPLVRTMDRRTPCQLVAAWILLKLAPHLIKRGGE